MGKSKTWERRIAAVKKAHRPKLQNWSKDGFATKRSADFFALRHGCRLHSHNGKFSVHRNEYTEEELTASSSSLTTTNLPYNASTGKRKSNESTILSPLLASEKPLRTIPILSSENLSVNDFLQKWEKPGLPCIIDNIPLNENWKAYERWNLKLLRRRFKNFLVKIGEDDEGYTLKIQFKYFLQYLQYNQDDSPLYLFDGRMDGITIAKSLIEEYYIPSYFPYDLFSLVGEKRRPPFRWFLYGPARSGTTCHLDPLGTSAWNTLLVGRKRWVLFPPGTERKVAKGWDEIVKGEDDEAINYFVDILPRIYEKYDTPDRPIYEFIQYPGQTIFVPGGWYHAVINLDDTIAITQNYCSPANFDEVWKQTRSGRKKLACKWLKALRESYPDLADRAEELNRLDGFIMADQRPPKEPKEKKKKKSH